MEGAIHITTAHPEQVEAQQRHYSIFTCLARLEEWQGKNQLSGLRFNYLLLSSTCRYENGAIYALVTRDTRLQSL